MTKRFRIAPWILLPFILFSGVAWASSEPKLILQETFGVHPAVFNYSEYEYNGNTVSVVRSDPRFFDFAVACAKPPKSVGQFHNENRSALLTLNGGYWDHDYLPTDLCVVEGRVIQPVNAANSHFGLFAVRRSGELVIDDLKTRPLSRVDVDGFRFALKSGPHLLRNGAPVEFKSSSSHARTVLGKDVQNNVLFVITKSGKMTYSEMVNFMIDSGLGITDAFNLDGGASAGFALGRGTDMILRDTVSIANVIQLTIKQPR
jgi:exopolysaccharide biosynthesis protein